jgi:quinol-cytochrome oxidoreductase complex cytochrome b subunit
MDLRDRGMQRVEIVDDPAVMAPELRGTLDGRARRWFLTTWPVKRLVPDAEPVYVKSWLYTLGVLTLASFIMLVLSGMVLAVFGPEWWLTNPVGHFMDSVHYWAVQLLFLFMATHFVSVFLMGAYRGKRGLTWVIGAVAFLASVATAFTEYASLQDYEAQWITTQGKDAISATGMGAFFNLLNPGQMITMHIVLFPLIVFGVVGAHLLWIRLHGICPPYDVPEEHLAPEEAGL